METMRNLVTCCINITHKEITENYENYTNNTFFVRLRELRHRVDSFGLFTTRKFQFFVNIT